MILLELGGFAWCGMGLGWLYKSRFLETSSSDNDTGKQEQFRSCKWCLACLGLSRNLNLEERAVKEDALVTVFSPRLRSIVR
jgi:hypothetical protein